VSQCVCVVARAWVCEVEDAAEHDRRGAVGESYSLHEGDAAEDDFLLSC
jgi:hypothetical protein